MYSFNNLKNRRSAGWFSGKGQRSNVADDLTNSETEHCLDNDRNIWINDDDNMNMYEDLLDDIRELLNSPEPQEDSVEMMNLANMRDTGKKTFLQCGTNITSSIWSANASMDDETAENTFNAALASTRPDIVLGLKLSAISIGNSFSFDGNWPVADVNMIAQNETNRFFENCPKLSNQQYRNSGIDFPSLPWNTSVDKLEKWSEAESCENEISSIHSITEKSLLKLNHNKDKSCFAEVAPRPIRPPFGIFGKSASCFLRPEGSAEKLESEKDKEDLLTSARSHFKPISEKVEVKGHRYADGTSFLITNSLDKVRAIFIQIEVV